MRSMLPESAPLLVAPSVILLVDANHRLAGHRRWQLWNRPRPENWIPYGQCRAELPPEEK